MTIEKNYRNAIHMVIISINQVSRIKIIVNVKVPIQIGNPNSKRLVNNNDQRERKPNSRNRSMAIVDSLEK
jgi:hypothetical protein